MVGHRGRAAELANLRSEVIAPAAAPAAGRAPMGGTSVNDRDVSGARDASGERDASWDEVLGEALGGTDDLLGEAVEAAEALVAAHPLKAVGAAFLLGLVAGLMVGGGGRRGT